MKIFITTILLTFLPLLALGMHIKGVVPDQKSHPLFPDCPDTPNCVSSLAKNLDRRVEPFPVKGSTTQSMNRLISIMGSLPRATITENNPGKVQAEFRSLLGFVDDVLLVLDPGGNVIHVRSASRTGSWDLGVNRRRVERIRKLYMEGVEER